MNSFAGASRERYLKEFAFVSEVAKGLRLNLAVYRVSQEHWVRFNELRDQGKDFGHIVKKTRIRDLAAAYLLEGLRVCIRKFDNDKDQVQQCLEGKIDP